MSAVNNTYDIIIVGGGLVGSSLAALLAQSSITQSLRIAVIDGGDAPAALTDTDELSRGDCFDKNIDKNMQAFDPRVVALTHASQHLFSQLGLWEKIIQQRACSYTDMQVWDNDGTASIHFCAQDIQQADLGCIVENTILQRAVLSFLGEGDQQSLPTGKKNNVDVLRGLQVDNITQNDGASKNGEPSTTRIVCSNGDVFSAALIVAADGGQSTVRQLVDMPTREWSYGHKAIVATVRSSQSHQSTAWQNFLSSGPLAFLPLDHPSHRYCSIVWSLENTLADDMMALNDHEFCQALGRAFQHRLGDVELVSQRYCFPLQQRHAVDYVKDNIVLVGDAAHTIHPLAGQGVNLGLLDAQALASEIIRGVTRGLAVNDPSLLRRYQRQRKANNLEVMLLMEGLKRLFGQRHIAVRWLRNVGLKKVNQCAPLKNWLAKQAIKH